MALEHDIVASREFEMQTYLREMKTLYKNAVAQNGETYDIAFSLTSAFSTITPAAILEDSRIIKILRYAIAPTISQMKFGQVFGLNSIGKFEQEKIDKRSKKHGQLSVIAGKIADFAQRNIDRTRFIWLSEDISDLALAQMYAKSWTCSLVADQNAQTAYRNWRSTKQEDAVASQLISYGYVKSGYAAVVRKYTDVKIGEFTPELRVAGRTVQKADIVFRSKKSKKLVLVEAKSVGVEIDATKRVKECCDKASDWGASEALGSPEIVAVIAGFFTERNIASLKASNVLVVWEHRLGDLEVCA